MCKHVWLEGAAGGKNAMKVFFDKELHVRVLLTEGPKKELSEAVRQSGQSLATWMRAKALREAARWSDR